MTARKGFAHSALGAALLVTIGLGVLSPASARAQAAVADARWTAWLGCWTVDSGAAIGAPTWTSGRHVCVVPGEVSSAIDIITVVNGQLVTREHIRADGSRQPRTDRDCSGWQSAKWSADGQRVFIMSAAACAGGRKVTSTGIMALAPNGDWLDVLGVSADANVGVRTVRYRPGFGVSTALPPTVSAALVAQTPAIDRARAAASAPITLTDVIEAARELERPTAQAWLVSNGTGFELSASRLVELSDAGVPAPVIDLVVALTYPKHFSLVASQPMRAQPTRQAASGDLRTPPSGSADCRFAPPWTNSGIFDCQSAWLLDQPWMFDTICVPIGGPTGWLRCTRGYDGYGYAGYNGNGYPYYPYGYLAPGTWYVGQDPFVVVTGGGGGAGGPSGPGPGHGRVINGRGYTQGGPTESGAPTSQPTSSSPAAPAPSSMPSGDSVPASSSSPSSEPRTAQPR